MKTVWVVKRIDHCEGEKQWGFSSKEVALKKAKEETRKLIDDYACTYPDEIADADETLYDNLAYNFDVDEPFSVCVYPLEVAQ